MISRSSYYRWQRKLPGKPGPKGLNAAVIDAMKQDIEELHHIKRRTWGTETIYDEYHGMIPRQVIRMAIEETRRRHRRQERKKATRYEFAAPGVAWSTDFMEVALLGRPLRVQDECSRLVLGCEMRQRWTDEGVRDFVKAGFIRYGPPLVFKFDRGSEFRSDVFQALLRDYRVVALPNPAYYPRANGKHERLNESVRQWLLPLTWENAAPEEIAQEMRDALIDNNEHRRKEVLGKRTPEDVYLHTPRAPIDRSVLYGQWDELQKKLQRREFPSIVPHGAWDAMRIAAVIVLKKHQLVRYFSSQEAHA